MMIKQFTRTLNSLVVATCLAVSVPSLAAETALDQSSSEIKHEQSQENFISLVDLANLIERWHKTKVLVGTLGNMKVQMNFGKDHLSYSQLLTQLNANGFTAFKSNGYIVIIPNRDARNMAIPIADKKQSYADDEYLTDFLKADKACVSKVLAVVRPLVPQYGMLTAYEEGNMLIIVDTYANIQRIKATIKAIDANLNEKEECFKK